LQIGDLHTNIPAGSGAAWCWSYSMQ